MIDCVSATTCTVAQNTRADLLEEGRGGRTSEFPWIFTVEVREGNEV
jgi:hypothetical protein